MLRLTLAFLTIILLIVSCSSHVRQDGPPHFYVDETQIPNAIPKPEPLAKYGNMRHYQVFGKRYYVLPSSRDYTAIGTASWYGTKFHQRLTSSGEPYDMLAMTAAHKTLPLPTYVEVTNLKNHRQVIVKVNDRGPFSGNRLIDLSYVAAKKLGMLGHGTAMVKIKAIDPYVYAQSVKTYHHVPTRPLVAHYAKPKKVSPLLVRYEVKKQPLKSKRVIYLQVGAFKYKSNALRLKSRLSSMFSTPVVIAQMWQKHLYQVQLGPILDTNTAHKLIKRLKIIGFKPNQLYSTT